MILLRNALSRLSERYADEPLWLPPPIKFKTAWRKVHVGIDEIRAWEESEYEDRLLEIIKRQIEADAGGDKPLIPRPAGKSYTTGMEVPMFQCIAVSREWSESVPHPDTGAPSLTFQITYPTKNLGG